MASVSCQVYHALGFLKKTELKLLNFLYQEGIILIPIGLYPIKLNYLDRQNGLGLQSMGLSVW